MELMYRSTRNADNKVSASQAVLKGLAEDGGLYVPERLPKLEISLETLADLSYQETAYTVMKQFLTDYTEEELKYCISHAYDEKFDTDEIVPIRKADGAYYLELFHGSTIAFKDMALSILPYLMTTAAKKNQEPHEIVILTATSGDTGKAALAGFADVPDTRIIVFYPKDGVSAVQEKQMVTQKGDNTCVIGIRGNFDDAQSGVKQLFSDKNLAAKLDQNGFRFSSANSINIGRLVPQIVYYVYAYGSLLRTGQLKAGEPMNVVVPTGNFGNILAAYYAKNMGLPIQRLICASNDNKVLFDFFQTGVYDRNREFILTSSPSMDILISSNLERLLYNLTDSNAERVAAWMDSLAKRGRYQVDEAVKSELNRLFFAGFCDDVETQRTIRELYQVENYLCDPHTAVAVNVYQQYVAATGDRTTPTIIASTASPYKFASSVLGALLEGKDAIPANEFEQIQTLSTYTGTPIPAPIAELEQKTLRFDQVCAKEELSAAVLDSVR